jgi:hypothetical protein
VQNGQLARVVVVLRARGVHAIYRGACMLGAVGHVESSICLAEILNLSCTPRD